MYDANNSLCIAIIQNIVITYLDLHRMSTEAKNQKGQYLEKAIELAEHTLKSVNMRINVINMRCC